MKSTLPLLLLVAATAQAQTPEAIRMANQSGLWRTDFTDKVPVWQKDSGFVNWLSPEDPVDPPPADLQGKVAAAARLVGEPAAALTIGEGYKTAWERVLDGKNYDEMVSAAVTFRSLAVSQSAKKQQWAAMFVALDRMIASSPKEAATLESVYKGFVASTEGQAVALPIAWQKLLLCLPCIFDAFLSAEEGAEEINIGGVIYRRKDPLPSVVVPAPVPMPRGSVRVQPGALPHLVELRERLPWTYVRTGGQR